MNTEQRHQDELNRRAGYAGTNFGFSPGTVRGRQERANHQLANRSANPPPTRRSITQTNDFDLQPEKKESGGGWVAAILLLFLIL